MPIRRIGDYPCTPRGFAQHDGIGPAGAREFDPSLE
jgi:hypothetical protein